jgi:hypothetical protein
MCGRQLEGREKGEVKVVKIKMESLMSTLEK